MQLIKFMQLIVFYISTLVFVTSIHAAPLAKVNGVAIPKSRLELVMKGLIAQGQKDTPETRNAVRDDLIKQEVLSQEAIRKKLDKDPDISTQIMITRQSVLIRALQADFIKNNNPAEKELREEYQAVSAASMGDQEYNPRHILLSTEAEAKDIIAKIKKGGKFEEIAKDKSTDDGSKNKGGELGWSSARSYSQPFAEALIKLKTGEITEKPVKTSFGWHIIRLDGMRPLKIPPFEEVKQKVQQRVLQQKFKTYLEKLKEKAKIE
ncbi:MAG: peptidylprolyl isomerase [Nitrosomonadaceae bacterium]|nr:peptidylprolyl isomerase [Nitrosomonadaceae bacterium]|tara:strand:+ start:53 stop:844 length:792 start_codon:yes stop_codon:yes gene_type:complete